MEERSRKVAALAFDGIHPQEYLLSALGQASGMCPRIEASLKTAAPAGYELDATGAHEFLTETAWGLEQAGFGVLLPAWWTAKGTKLHLTARAAVKSPKMRGGGGLTLDSLIRFDWEIALGETTLTLEELDALARLKAPLVKIRGQWVQLNAEEIQAAIDLWKKKAAGQARVREVIQMALGATRAIGSIEFEGVRADGWIAELLAQLEGRAAFEELATPDGFMGELRAYQARGYSWLAFLRRWGWAPVSRTTWGWARPSRRWRCIQRDGKRRAAAGAADLSHLGGRELAEGGGAVHARACRCWFITAAAHEGERFRGRRDAHAWWCRATPAASRSRALAAVSWAGVVLDEAQNIKNPETKQARAARSLLGRLPHRATGTPVENTSASCGRSWSSSIPGYLGSRAEFKRDSSLPIERYRDPRGRRALEAAHRRPSSCGG